MTDKLRGALFDILGSSMQDSRVLDLFAGTGAVGIEALSRGAAYVDFVDISKQAVHLIRENLALLGHKVPASVHQTDASKFVSAASQMSGYDVIFFTPPYADFDGALLHRCGALLQQSGWLIAEKDRFVPDPEPASDTLQLIRRRAYGDTVVLIYERVS